MCARYYIDGGTEEETTQFFHYTGDTEGLFRTGDVHPGDPAPVVISGRTEEKGSRVRILSMRWGFPVNFGEGRKKGQLLINARSETAEVKKTFQACAAHRRCLFPAESFYEWDLEKNRFTFREKDRHLMLIAGLYDLYNEENRCIILTCAANSSMAPVHDRMPLILEGEDAMAWLSEGSSWKELLHKPSPLLSSRADYIQQSFF